MRFWRGFAGFLLGLLVTATLLYAVVPNERPGLDEALAQHRSCQVLIVGPSYVGEGIDEGAFEREAKRLGLGLKACKYAPHGLQGYEVRHVLELLLAEPWPKLRFLVVDISLGSGVAFDSDNWFKPRVVDWHTFSAVPWLWHYYTDRGQRPAKLPVLVGHLEHLAMNYLGIGRGIALVEKLRLPSEGESAPSLPRIQRRERRERPEGNAYEALRRRLIRDKARLRGQTRPDDEAWPRELEALAKAHGQRRVVFLVSPILTARRPPKAGRHAPLVLDFDDPERYPELYTEDVRGGTSHLNEAGARIYSALLARSLVELGNAR